MRYSVLGVDGRIRRHVDIELTGGAMIHDFSLTEHYVVIYDLPVVFDPDKATQSAGGVDVYPYSWDPDYPSRVGVLPRDGDGRDIRWFEVTPCCVYHGLNAYEEGDRIVADIVRHPEMYMTDGRPLEFAPSLERWTIDLAGGKVHEQCLDDRGHEFPRVDERLTGRPHRYGYTISVGEQPPEESPRALAIAKHDLSTGTCQIRDFGPGHAVDEFVFVPRGPDAGEDDGVLMGYVYDGNRDRSDLVLIDAATLDTVAEIHLPVRVPHGIHGNWFPSDAGG